MSFVVDIPIAPARIDVFKIDLRRLLKRLPKDMTRETLILMIDKLMGNIPKTYLPWELHFKIVVGKNILNFNLKQSNCMLSDEKDGFKAMRTLYGVFGEFIRSCKFIDDLYAFSCYVNLRAGTSEKRDGIFHITELITLTTSWYNRMKDVYTSEFLDMIHKFMKSIGATSEETEVL